ncbi:hypothetical protein CXIVA_16330 [Clostridium sp. SY8519]|nr:hypothetical protein CXIVA_16330 [Clostridium sp. SY8519]
MILDLERETGLEYSPCPQTQKGSGFPKHLPLGHSTGHSKSNVCSITAEHMFASVSFGFDASRNVTRNVTVQITKEIAEPGRFRSDNHLNSAQYISLSHFFMLSLTYDMGVI